MSCHVMSHEIYTAHGGIGLRLKNIKKIIEGGFVLRLHGSIVNWKKLETDLTNRNLSPGPTHAKFLLRFHVHIISLSLVAAQREKLFNSKNDAEMKAYSAKAVKFVEDGKDHPGGLIHQPFVHNRMLKFHTVSVCVLCVKISQRKCLHYAFCT